MSGITPSAESDPIKYIAGKEEKRERVRAVRVCESIRGSGGRARTGDIYQIGACLTYTFGGKCLAVSEFYGFQILISAPMINASGLTYYVCRFRKKVIIKLVCAHKQTLARFIDKLLHTLSTTFFDKNF